MKLTGEKKMNMSSRISPQTLAFLCVAALLLVLGAVMSVRSQASVAATAVSAPSSMNVAAENDFAARRSTAISAAASHTAMLERSKAAAAAQYTAIAEYYVHGPFMLAKPAIGNGSVTSEIAVMGEDYAAIEAAALELRNAAARHTAMGNYYAGRTAPSEKHVPGGGR